MDFKGVIIEESLANKDVLGDLKIISTNIESVTPLHKTPWLKKWILHTVEIPEATANAIADKISKCLETEHNWYADFKNEDYHYIIFRGKVFKVTRNTPKGYETAKRYGLSLGIPDYQLDFSPDIKV